MGVDSKMIPMISYKVLKMGECDFEIRIIITYTITVGISVGNSNSKKNAPISLRFMQIL